jgi:hypothetical protein
VAELTDPGAPMKTTHEGALSEADIERLADDFGRK